MTLNGGQIVDMSTLIDSHKKGMLKEIKELEAKSKPLEELVVTERFYVDGVLGTSENTSFTPMSEVRIGGRSSHYKGGYISRLVIKVSSAGKGLPVKTLNFLGNSPVKVGDRISASMPRYDQKKISSSLFSRVNFNDENIFYFDREYRETESAIEISILGGENQVLRTDRAVDYAEFVKK